MPLLELHQFIAQSGGSWSDHTEEVLISSDHIVSIGNSSVVVGTRVDLDSGYAVHVSESVDAVANLFGPSGFETR